MTLSSATRPLDGRPVASCRAPCIMVAEDEMLAALYISSLLSELGCEVSAVVATADGALRAAAERRPDLVLMDIALRGALDGIAAAELLRERFGVPVLFVTAHADGATRDRAMVAAPVGYLLKPFLPGQLEAAIRAALGRDGQA